MKKKVFKFGNWQRTKSKYGTYYFHNGKRTGKENFDRANKRRIGKRIVIFIDEITRESKEILSQKRVKQKSKRIQRQPKIALCRVTDRQKLYEQIKSDRRALFNKLSDEEFSALRIVVDIGKSKKTKRCKESQRGHRTFIDLRKFKNFLGLNYKYNESGLHESVDWTKRGVCKYEKSVSLTVRRMRGERILKEKTIKEYAIQQP